MITVFFRKSYSSEIVFIHKVDKSVDCNIFYIVEYVQNIPHYILEQAKKVKEKWSYMDE